MSVAVHNRPGPIRQLMAMVYDFLLLLSALLFAAIIPVALNGGEAITPGNVFFLLYLLSVCFLFYGWFWTHGGQTLGMRAWKIKLISLTTPSISWKQAAIRFSLGVLSWLCLGLGFWWQWLSKDKQSWYNQVAKTSLIFIKE
ncbi:MAG: RDD family protein [Pseudomonadota bacterium]|nr:RDD family protein [Pseudomonadota bacterium]